MGITTVETLHEKLEEAARDLIALGERENLAGTSAWAGVERALSELDDYYDRTDREKRTSALWNRIYRELVDRPTRTMRKVENPGSCSRAHCSRRGGWQADEIPPACKPHLTKAIEGAAHRLRRDTAREIARELGIETPEWGYAEWQRPEPEVVAIVAQKLGVEQ
jgi:hypothetical protein